MAQGDAPQQPLRVAVVQLDPDKVARQNLISPHQLPEKDADARLVARANQRQKVAAGAPGGAMPGARHDSQSFVQANRELVFHVYTRQSPASCAAYTIQLRRLK